MYQLASYRLRESLSFFFPSFERPADRISTAVNDLLHAIDYPTRGNLGITLFQGAAPDEGHSWLYKTLTASRDPNRLLQKPEYGDFPPLHWTAERSPEAIGQLQAYLVGTSRPMVVDYKKHCHPNWGADWRGVVHAVRSAERTTGTCILGALAAACRTLDERAKDLLSRTGLPEGYSQSIIVYTDGYESLSQTQETSYCNQLITTLSKLDGHGLRPSISIILVGAPSNTRDPLSGCLPDTRYDLRYLPIENADKPHIWLSEPTLQIDDWSTSDGCFRVKGLEAKIETAGTPVEPGGASVTVCDAFLYFGYALNGAEEPQFCSIGISGLHIVESMGTHTPCGQALATASPLPGTSNTISFDFVLRLPVWEIIDRFRSVIGELFLDNEVYQLDVGEPSLQGSFSIAYADNHASTRAEELLPFMTDSCQLPRVSVTVKTDPTTSSTGCIELQSNVAAHNLCTQSHAIPVCIYYPESLVFFPGEADPVRLDGSFCLPLDGPESLIFSTVPLHGESKVYYSDIRIQCENPNVLLSGDVIAGLCVAHIGEAAARPIILDLKDAIITGPKSGIVSITIPVGIAFPGDLTIGLDAIRLPPGIRFPAADDQNWCRIPCDTGAGTGNRRLALAFEFDNPECLLHLNEIENELRLTVRGSGNSSSQVVLVDDHAIADGLPIDLTYHTEDLLLRVSPATSADPMQPGDVVATIALSVLGSDSEREIGELAQNPDEIVQVSRAEGSGLEPVDTIVATRDEQRFDIRVHQDICENDGECTQQRELNLSSWTLVPPSDILIFGPEVLHFTTAPPSIPSPSSWSAELETEGRLQVKLGAEIGWVEFGCTPMRLRACHPAAHPPELFYVLVEPIDAPQKCRLSIHARDNIHNSKLPQTGSLVLRIEPPMAEGSTTSMEPLLTRNSLRMPRPEGRGQEGCCRRQHMGVLRCWYGDEASQPQRL